MAEEPEKTITDAPPKPIRLRRTVRPMGRPNSYHLLIERDAVACTQCGARVVRKKRAAVVMLEHLENCPVFAQAA